MEFDFNFKATPAKSPFWRCIQEIAQLSSTMLCKDTKPNPEEEAADVRKDLEAIKVQVEEAFGLLDDPMPRNIFLQIGPKRINLGPLDWFESVILSALNSEGVEVAGEVKAAIKDLRR